MKKSDDKKSHIELLNKIMELSKKDTSNQWSVYCYGIEALKEFNKIVKEKFEEGLNKEKP